MYDPACGIGDVLAQLSEAVVEPTICRMVAHDINEQAFILTDQRGFLRHAPFELDTVDVLAKNPDPQGGQRRWLRRAA